MAPWKNHSLFNLYVFSSGKNLKNFAILKYTVSIEILTINIIFCSILSVGLWRMTDMFCCSPVAVLKSRRWSLSLMGLSSDNLWFRLAEHSESLYLLALFPGWEGLSSTPVGHLGTDTVVSQAQPDPTLLLFDRFLQIPGLRLFLKFP